MASADRVPLVPARRLLAVRVRLNGRVDTTLAVDTGAERMVISPDVAAALGLDLDHPLRHEELVGVGSTGPIPVVRLDRVDVGASVVENLIASVYDLPPLIPTDGLLGLSFLARFRVTFEFDTRTLVLRPPPAPRR